MTTHRDIQREELNKFLEANKGKFEKVLEIGAAGGDEKEAFANIGVKDYTMIDNFKQYKRDDVIEMDVHKLKFQDNIFDCVFMSHTAEHFLNPLVAFEEILRVLKKGGKVFSITPYHCKHQVLEGDPDHVFVLTDLQWTKILSFVGFSSGRCHIQIFYNGLELVDQNKMCITEGVK